jgi:hypothetical protein
MAWHDSGHAHARSHRPSLICPRHHFGVSTLGLVTTMSMMWPKLQVDSQPSCFPTCSAGGELGVGGWTNESDAFPHDLEAFRSSCMVDIHTVWARSTL